VTPTESWLSVVMMMALLPAVGDSGAAILEFHQKSESTTKFSTFLLKKQEIMAKSSQNTSESANLQP
jgi:hypothetical protein